MSILKTAGASRALRIGLALGVAGATLVGAVVTGQSAQAAGTSVSPATGPTAGGNVVTLNASGLMDAAGVTSQVYAVASHGVNFQSATSCATTAPAATSASVVDVAAAGFTLVSASKAVVTVPSGVIDTTTSGVESKKDWYLCVYANAGTHKVLASAKYTVYPVPTIAASNGIIPASGPSFGGQSVTVTGTYFSAKTTATLGGVALTNLKVAKDGNSFTATTPANAAGATALVVTTEGGSATLASGGTGHYTYANAITVTPQTGVVAGGTALTIDGVGFNALKADFAAGKADVLFTFGQFNLLTVSAKVSNGGIARCTNVQIVSDTQLVCTTPDFSTTGANVAVAESTGASFSVQVVDDANYTWTLGKSGGAGYATPATTVNVVSSGASFTAGAF